MSDPRNTGSFTRPGVVLDAATNEIRESWVTDAPLVVFRTIYPSVVPDEQSEGGTE